MGFYFDEEQIEKAGGIGYSKYGRAIRSSSDLKISEELKKKCGQKGEAWLSEAAPKTIWWEEGDNEFVCEQLVAGIPGWNPLRWLRMSKWLPDDERRKRQCYVTEIWESAPTGEEDCPRIDFTKYSVYVEQGESNTDSRLASNMRFWEDRCDEEQIMRALSGRSAREAAAFLAPWKMPNQNKLAWELQNRFSQFSDEKKRKVLDMYRRIAERKDVSPQTADSIYWWAAKEWWNLPEVEDKVQGCMSLKKVKRFTEGMLNTFIAFLEKQTWNRDEKSFLVLKRLDSHSFTRVPYYLGIKYLEGYGCAKDYQEAYKCFLRGKEIAPQSEREKCSNMATYAVRKSDCYELFKIAKAKLETEYFNDGISRLEKLAKENRLAEAAYEAARLYESGYRCKTDEEKALLYYRIAAEDGMRPAMEKMIELQTKKMKETENTGYWLDVQKLEWSVAHWKDCLERVIRKNYSAYSA